MAVTAHDIRMKEFKRAFLRGYSADDVDTFLMYLAVEMDRRDRSYRGLAAGADLPDSSAPTPDPVQTLNEELFDASDLAIDPADPARSPTPQLAPSPRPGEPSAAPATAHDDKRHAVQLPPPPVDTLADIAQREADAIIAEARARAERGIERAKDHAREIVASARSRQVEAERAEEEAALRLAHLEQRVAERAAVLSAEARRLDALAASLAEHDLAPALEEYHTPAHAADNGGADVVQFARTADD